MRAILALALSLLAVPAQAQQAPCRAHDDLVRHLASEYREKPVVVALTSNGMLLEFLASSHGETWTILVTRPDGIACMVMSGVGYERITVPQGEPS